ncbi:MAG: hypothetical protein M3155_08310 [Actinomycetota bacterium]|nr:hypothetical protein [Actinomycetota bacterium]
MKHPETQGLLLGHADASRWVERHAAHEVTRIERRLSAMNRTLASQTSLGLRRSSISRARLIRKLRLYRRLYRQVDLTPT